MCNVHFAVSNVVRQHLYFWSGIVYRTFQLSISNVCYLNITRARFETIRQLRPETYPITTLSSSGKSYAGTSKFNGAGPFLTRPLTS